MNTDFIVSDPKLVESIVKSVFIAELNARKIKPDWILSYPPFGLAIAYALARQTGAKFGYVDTKKEECNFDIKPNDIIVVIGDDIYSGGSIKKTINIAKAKGANVVSAISERGHLYKENECPMCKVGSKPVSPRINWNKLKIIVNYTSK